MLERSWYWLKNGAYLAGVPVYAALLRRQLASARTDRDRFRLARRFALRGYSLRPYQVEDEIVALLAELRQRGVRRVVEIGTAAGGTLFLLLNALPRDGIAVSVDLPGGPLGGGYPPWKIALFHAAALGGPRLVLLRGSSQTEQMRQRVAAALDDRADFIFVDGDHSYEGARRDFELYREIVRPGGLMGFHDIVPGNGQPGYGVPTLWRQLKARHPHRELVTSWTQGGYGIGLLYL